MIVRTINIAREGDYGNAWDRVDPNKPLIAKIRVGDSLIDQVLTLSPELSGRIVALIQEEIVRAAKQVASMMDQAFESQAFSALTTETPQPLILGVEEAPHNVDQSPTPFPDDEIPF